MKLLYSLAIILMLSSCQSEYQKQLNMARKLVSSEQRIKSSYSPDFKNDSAESIKEINEDIEFQARMSGNETYFMQEIEAYRKSLERENTTPLITRFP